MRREARIDRVRIKLDAKTVRRDAASGYARIWGRVIGANQFLRYGRADGRPNDNHIEFIPRSTVNDAEAIASLKLKPVTFHHPPEMLTAKNTTRFMIGSVVDVEFRPDDDGLWVDHLIVDESTLDRIDEGIVEISAAYTSLIDDTGGEFEGRRFDSVQSSRRYNHISILPDGRAGPENRLRIDAISPTIFDAGGLRIQRLEDPMRKIKIDGKSVEVADEVAAAFEAQDQEFELFKKKKEEEDKKKADAENLKKEEDKKKADAEKAKAKDSDSKHALGDAADQKAADRAEVVKDVLAGMEVARKSRDQADGAMQTLRDAAKPMLAQSYSFDGKSADEVMRAAIVAQSPDSKALADAATGDKLAGMFEQAKVGGSVAPKHALGDKSLQAADGDDKDIHEKRLDKAAELYRKKIGGQEALRHPEYLAVGSK